MASRREERRASDSNQANQQRDDQPVGDETKSYEEIIFGQRRPDSLAIDWTNKMVYVLEFKRTSDQRRDYRERGESRALAQHDVLIRSLEKVLGVVESKRGAIRKGLVHELLYAQDTVLCSYFAQREGATNGDRGLRNTVAEVFQGLDRFG
jgi:hypothetical protein